MINNSHYKKLCKYCDKLIGYNPSISRLSISFLHIIRPHHIHSNNYKLIFSKSNFSFFSHVLRKLIKTLSSFIMSFLKVLSERNSFKIDYSNVDVIFVSHLFNIDQTQSSKDLYFNDLYKDLKLNSVKPGRIYINHSKNKLSLKDDIIIGNSSLFNELFIRLLQLKEFVLLFYSCILNSKTNIEKRIKLLASLESLSYSTLYNLRIYFFFKKLMKTYYPKVVITTFEGHAYERIIYKVINSSSNIISAGYQHSAIFKYQHSIRRSIDNNYKPKYIFSSGKITSDILSKGNNQNNIIELGSSRGEVINKKNIDSSYYLVVPEGMIEDVDLFLEFVSQITKTNSDKKFLFRFHPAISEKQIMTRQLAYKQNLQIIFSNNSLQEDIEKSNFVLYSGSTAVFSSIISGLTPIYYDYHELDLNPLYQLRDTIQYVKSVEDFNRIKEDSEINKRKNITYCKAYFSNFDFTKIIDLIR